MSAIRTHRIPKDMPIEQLIPLLDRLPFLRVWQAAALMGVSESHVYELIRRGAIPVVRWGSSVRIVRADLDDLRGKRQ